MATSLILFLALLPPIWLPSLSVPNSSAEQAISTACPFEDRETSEIPPDEAGEEEESEEECYGDHALTTALNFAANVDDRYRFVFGFYLPPHPLLPPDRRSSPRSPPAANVFLF